MNALKFNVRHGGAIDLLQIMLGDGVKNVYSSEQGGHGGSLSTWDVPPGQYVTQVEYRSNTLIQSLTFITNTGIKSPYYGGGGGMYWLVTFPEGYRIIGFFGRSSDRLDRLGFILGKTIYPPNGGEPYIDVIRKTLTAQ